MQIPISTMMCIKFKSKTEKQENNNIENKMPFSNISISTSRYNTRYALCLRKKMLINIYLILTDI